MSQYTADEMEAPSWMNSRLFQFVVENYLEIRDPTVYIRSIRITPAKFKGVHFSSVIFKVTINYDTKSSSGKKISLIIKTMPETEGYKLSILRHSHIFETECDMYFDEVRQAEECPYGTISSMVWKTRLLCKSLDSEPKWIIFLNLAEEGYSNVRGRLANLDEAKAVFKTLAKWHAITYMRGIYGDQKIIKFRESLLNLEGFLVKDFLSSGISNFTDKLETMDYLKTYVPNLRKVQKDLVQRCVASFNLFSQNKTEGIFALCHGDFQAKNLMFKKNDMGVLDNVLFVDFGYSFYGPLIIDVIYGLYMVLNADLRLNHRNEIVHYYAINFIEVLERYYFPKEKPKISDFFIEMLRHKHWELLLLSTFLPMWYAASEDGLEEEDLLTSNDARKLAYDNESYLGEVRRVLPIMYYQGYLD